MLADPVDVLASADPVAAVLAAAGQGRRIALRTSGSTGAPRAVVRTASSWIDSFPEVAELTGLEPASRLWLPGPLTSTMNLFAAVLACWRGASLVDDPRRATHAQLTPLALRQLLDDPGSHAVLTVTVAGDRLSPALHERATDAGLRVNHYYGAAELSFVAWGPHGAALRPFPGVEVQVREGKLWVRSPFLAEGYAGPPGPLRFDDDGFATVGDRGALSDGVLTVEGRGADAVTTAGATVPVADVETALRDVVTGDLVVVGMPHAVLGEVVAAVLTQAGDHAAAWRIARERLAAAQRPRRWFHLAALPMTPAGKVDRAAVVAMLAAAIPLTGSGQERS